MFKMTWRAIYEKQKDLKWQATTIAAAAADMYSR